MIGVLERILGCTLSGDLQQDLEDGVVRVGLLVNRVDPVQTRQETSS